MSDTVLPVKSLERLDDILSEESVAIKKYHFYAASCTDPKLKTIYENAEQMHRRHFESIFKHLNAYASKSN